VTRKVEKQIQVACQKLRSPQGLDANDLLRKGLLWRFLEVEVVQ